MADRGLAYAEAGTMPDVYRGKDYDLAGFAVYAAERSASSGAPRVAFSGHIDLAG